MVISNGPTNKKTKNYNLKPFLSKVIFFSLFCYFSLFNKIKKLIKKQ